jgi:hypothetical protein
MNFKEALRIFNIKDKELTKKELKKLWHKLIFEFHPDKGGDVETAKNINAAYDYLINSYSFKKESTEKAQKEESEKKPIYWKLTPEMEAVYNKINHLDGLKFEIIWQWLWVSGLTYTHRKTLLSAGLKYSNKKKCWYWHDEDYKKKSKKIWNLEKIRAYFGSTELEKKAALL